MSDRMVRPQTVSAISARKRKKFIYDLQMQGVEVPGVQKIHTSSLVHKFPLSSDLKRNDAKLIKILTHQEEEGRHSHAVNCPANVSNLKEIVRVMADDVSVS
eukprot:766535-Hanusia_phi.AAC.2